MDCKAKGSRLVYTLRKYQADAVQSLFDYFAENNGNPVLSLPTAAGKSIIQAAFIQQTLALWPDERFLLVSHVKEILQQDADKIQALMPNVTVGIYSAGLGRKETGYQVTIAGIQSVYKRAHEMGDVSIVIVDECHLVSKTKDSMYHKFLDGLQQICPNGKIIGLSATPYRLDSGPLIKGDNRIFTDICYQITIKELIEQGYLSPLVTAPTKNKANTSDVKKRGGEYITGDLERFMNTADITEAALTEVDTLCADRKSWLVFCVGVDHARDVAQALRMHGHAAEIVIGDTPKDLRAQRLADFKAGKIRALVSVGVLTTGFDAPNADALICLRPTLSPGLWVQIVGRVTRICEGKTDALILDFTSNLHIHGPVDLIDIDGDGNVKTSPFRVCPECGKLIQPRAKACECGYSFERECHKCHSLFDRALAVCPDCGAFVQQRKRKIDHETKASEKDILSGAGDLMTEDIEYISMKRHTKKGKPDSVKLSYHCTHFPYASYDEWLCFDHGGSAAQKAAMRWVRLGGSVPTPGGVDEAL
ncbi:MAG: DEAD/DEAH box helicase, partial [Candidatus Hodarchaeales archaeon]